MVKVMADKTMPMQRQLLILLRSFRFMGLLPPGCGHKKKKYSSQQIQADVAAIHCFLNDSGLIKDQEEPLFQKRNKKTAVVC